MPDRPQDTPTPTESERLLSDLPGVAYVASATAERTLLSVYAASADLLGRTPDELTAEGAVPLLDLVDEDERERVRREVERSLATGEPFDVRYFLHTPEGHERWIWDRGRPVRTGEDGEKVIHGLLTDVTRQRYLEMRAISSQRKEALGELTGVVAHEFNNILTAILGPVEFALEEGPDEGPVSEELLTARNAVNRGAELNRHLLAFARRQPWSDEVVNLNAVVGEMEGLLRNVLGTGIRIMLVYDPQLSPVGVDPNHIKQVILNLALNARDAMNEGGKLVLQTGNVELTPSDLRSDDEMCPGTYVTLTLRDSGTGIDPAIKSRIFEPFFTTRKGKSGLGLSTAFGIARQAGGFMRIRSHPGEGTTATVFLPSMALAKRAGGEEEGAEEEGDRPSVLVVDDDEAVRRVAARILQRAGYSVLEASGGRDALRLAEETGEPLDLLVTDVKMPGMGGVALAHRMARLHPAVRVLVMSGFASTEEMLEVGLDPDDAFLPKPFTPKELTEAVRQVQAARPWRERHPEVERRAEGGAGPPETRGSTPPPELDGPGEERAEASGEG